MSMFRKIMDSKFMDGVEFIADLGVEFVKTTAEVIADTFSHEISNESNIFKTTEEKENKTYDYWMGLDYNGQKYYFENNQYLKDYIKNDYYPNDRELTAKHVQAIADKLNKDFTNINNRY